MGELLTHRARWERTGIRRGAALRAAAPRTAPWRGGPVRPTDRTSAG
ncbi:hypothetical protein [Pseudonocardia sp.]